MDTNQNQALGKKIAHIKAICSLRGIPFEDVVAVDGGIGSQKYQNFCEALALSPPPTLIVLKGGSSINESGFHGVYNEHSGCIFMPESVLQAFEKGNHYAEYVMAHEGGHATSRTTFSRRQFVRTLTAAAAGGAVGFGTHSLGRKILTGDRSVAVRDQEPLSEVEATTCKTAGVISGLFAAKQMHGALQRWEELNADAKAEDAIGAVGVLQGLTKLLEKQVCGRADFSDVKAKFGAASKEYKKQNGKHLSEDERTFLWAKTLLEAYDKPRPLSDIIKGNYYPKTHERVRATLDRSAGASRFN